MFIHIELLLVLYFGSTGNKMWIILKMLSLLLFAKASNPSTLLILHTGRFDNLWNPSIPLRTYWEPVLFLLVYYVATFLNPIGMASVRPTFPNVLDCINISLEVSLELTFLFSQFKGQKKKAWHPNFSPNLCPGFLAIDNGEKKNPKNKN